MEYEEKKYYPYETIKFTLYTHEDEDVEKLQTYLNMYSHLFRPYNYNTIVLRTHVYDMHEKYMEHFFNCYKHRQELCTCMTFDNIAKTIFDGSDNDSRRVYFGEITFLDKNKEDHQKTFKSLLDKHGTHFCDLTEEMMTMASVFYNNKSQLHLTVL